GEVADGLLGAARLGGTALAAALVFGAIAGRESGARASQVPRCEVPAAGLNEEEKRIAALTQGTEMSPADGQKDVKSVMWKYAGMAKTEQSLQEACKKLAKLKSVSMKVKSGDAREIGQA